MRFLIVVLSLVLLSPAAMAGSRNQWLNDAGTGQFIMHAGNDWQPALLLNTQADVVINGPVAEVTLTQKFRSQSKQFTEGTYVFPLPDNAAVHGMDMTVGTRHIRGEIHEKATARKIYEEARSTGRQAGLVEQLRPNMFTTSVANIAPQQVISVTLHYTQIVKRDGLQFQFDLPLTITPRYAPADAASYTVPAHRVDTVPKSIKAAANATRHMGKNMLQAHVSVHLNPGLPSTIPASGTTKVDVQKDATGYRIALADGAMPMDKDFTLSWSLVPQARATATFLTDEVDGRHYGMLMMMPPKADATEKAVPREQILVIDHSGSMGGARMRQARKSALIALNRLTAKDRFNIIVFDDRHHALFPQPVKADATHLQKARDFIHGIEAEGGTEVIPALKAAFAMHHEPGFLRQIIFMTDAAVSNGDAILRVEQQHIGQGRLFAVGVGSAVNAFLIDRMGQYGNGSSITIRNASQVAPHMQTLLQKLAHPAITDIRVTLPVDVDATFSPQNIPDLYQGEPVIVTARMSRIPKRIVITGRNPDPWKVVLHPVAQSRPGVARLWARRRIGELMDKLIQGGDKDTLKQRITTIALRHQLVSRFTSFVAVAEKPVRKPGDPLQRDAIQGRLPADMQTAQRGFPKTGLGTSSMLAGAAILFLLALIFLLTARRLDHGAH